MSQPAKTLDDVLMIALHDGVRDARAAWAEVRRLGQSDANIAWNVSEVFGRQGRHTDPPASWKGRGGDPAFWWGSAECEGEPTLSGKALWDKVRELLDLPRKARRPKPIPTPKPFDNVARIARQQRVFGVGPTGDQE